MGRARRADEPINSKPKLRHFIPICGLNEVGFSGPVSSGDSKPFNSELNRMADVDWVPTGVWI